MATQEKLTASQTRARSAWGIATTPDWIAELAKRCDASSQAKVADQLEISPAVVNQLLGNRYTGRLDRMEERVRGAFMKKTVECPVLGTISTLDCQTYQQQKFRPTNATRVALRRACRTCPNREGAK
jgi:hypothetical protein